MIHEDGIEVYLTPCRKKNDHWRFPELELEDDDALRKRCCIPVIEKEFKVVVKFSKTFDMFSSECIAVRVAGDRASFQRIESPFIVVRSKVAGQVDRYTHHGGLHATPLGYKMKASTDNPPRRFSVAKSSGLLLRSIRAIEQAANGNIIVLLAHGSAKDLDDDDPALYSRYSDNFKQLKSGNGQTYIFEFCSRSKAAFIEDKKLLQHFQDLGTPEGETCNITFIQDPTLTGALAETSKIRKKLSAAWKARRASRTLVSSTQPKGPRPVIPQTCACPVETHFKPKTRTKANFTPTSRPLLKESGDDEADGGTDPAVAVASSSGESKQAQNQTKEDGTSVTTCGQCSKYKKPPRGKKLAWRQSTGRWMYVPKDAPDGFAPAEEEDADEPSATVVNTSSEEPHANEVIEIEHRGVISPPSNALDTDITAATGSSEGQIIETNPGSESVADTEVLPTDTITGTIERSGHVVTPAATPESIEPKKRKGSNEQDASVQKKLCIDFDFSMDGDDDDVVFVKAEALSQSRCTSGGKPKDEVSQKEVESEMRMLERMFELKTENAEIMRDLAAHEQKQSKRSVKDEPVVKVEK